MREKLFLFVSALLLVAAANLNVCCTVSVNGEPLAGSYSPGCAGECLYLSELAAEEICEGAAIMPAVTTSSYLSLRPPRNDRQDFTDRVLRETGGVSMLKTVYVKGRRLGSVSGECDIRTLLKENIVSQQPNSAEYGVYSGEILIEQCYGRSGSETESADMVLLVSGMAPVMYFDGDGERA